MSDHVTCPECYGGGYRTWYPGPFGIMPERRMCWKCCGRGYIEKGDQ